MPTKCPFCGDNTYNNGSCSFCGYNAKYEKNLREEYGFGDVPYYLNERRKGKQSYIQLNECSHEHNLNHNDQNYDDMLNTCRHEEEHAINRNRPNNDAAANTNYPGNSQQYNLNNERNNYGSNPGSSLNYNGNGNQGSHSTNINRNINVNPNLNTNTNGTLNGQANQFNQKTTISLFLSIVFLFIFPLASIIICTKELTFGDCTSSQKKSFSGLRVVAVILFILQLFLFSFIEEIKYTGLLIF